MKTNPVLRLLLYLLLAAESILFLLPLVWMLVTALKPIEQTMAVPPTWAPLRYTVETAGETVAVKLGKMLEDGRIDVVVNNAAIYATVTRSPLEEIDPAEWDLVMGVNLKGPWLVTRAVSPHLPAGGRIINLSSATVMSGSAQWAHYVASKGGVIALTRVMAKELGARDITVNAVAPGFTLTEASLNLMDDAATYGVDR